MIVMHLKTEDVRSGYDEGGGCGGVLGAGWCFVAVKLYYSQKPRLCSDPPQTYNNNNSTPQHGARKTVHSTRAAYQAYVLTVLCNVATARDR